MHLMRWWQFFPKIFLYPYHLCTRLKSIFNVGISWKITQVTRMLAWLTFVRSEEDDPLAPRPSTLSWRDHLFWDLPSRLLLFGLIPIRKWGLRPNIRVQVFALTESYIQYILYPPTFLLNTYKHMWVYFSYFYYFILYLFTFLSFQSNKPKIDLSCFSFIWWILKFQYM